MGVYAVVTADVVRSREHDLSLEILKETLEGFAGGLLAKSFSVSRGDELQAVLSDLEALPMLLRRLRYCVLPLRLRIGVGIGFIEDSAFLKAGSSWDMSGKVFFDARSALDGAKKSKDAQTVVACEEENLRLFLNTVFILKDAIESDWTEKQWEAVHTYEREGTYERAATALGVTAPNVQNHCAKAKWNAIKSVETNMSAALRERFSGI